MRLRTLGLAAGASLVLLVPCVLLLQEDDGAPTSRVEPDSSPGSEARVATPPPASGTHLEPPSPDEQRPAPAAATTPRSQATRPTGPARPLSPTARLVALRKLEDRRPEEVVTDAEELVRDIAAEPGERTVLLATLGILDRVPGGDGALLRLASSPPTPEVGELAQGYLDRRK